MISERKLASEYTSFWRAALPLADHFVRQMNESLQTFAQPLEFDLSAVRSALVSETGFRLLDSQIKTGRRGFFPDSIDSITLAQAARESWLYLRELKGSSRSIEEIAPHEADLALQIAGRLGWFFFVELRTQSLLSMPRFEGCGVVDSCEGDVLADRCLYEIKNVERRFRLVDVRQVMVYAALNYTKDSYPIEEVGWINARSGKFYQINVQSLAKRTAGVSASELLAEIIEFISTETASR